MFPILGRVAAGSLAGGMAVVFLLAVRPAPAAADARPPAIAAMPPGPALAAEDGADPGCRGALRENQARWPQPLPTPWQAARLLFVQGACLQNQGRHGEAYQALQRGFSLAPGLSTAWRLRMLRSALAAGNHETAAALLREIVAQPPPGEVAAAVRAVLAEWLTSLPQGGSAVERDLLAAYLLGVEPAEEDTDLILRLLPQAEQAGDDALRWKLQVFLWRLPRDEDSAVRWAPVGDILRANRLDPGAGAWRGRMWALYRLRLLKRLVRELEAPGVVIADPEEAKRVGGYYFRSLVRLRQYGKAARQAAKPSVRRRFAMGPEDALLQGIRVDLRRHHLNGALAKLKRWRKAAYPAETLPEIYLGLAREYERRKDVKGVVRWGKRLLKEFPDHPLAAAGAWLPFWNLYAAGELEQAASWADRAIASTQPLDPEERARFFYWRARLYAAQGNLPAAQETLEALHKLWPTSYYGLIASLPDGKNPAPPRFSAAGQAERKKSPPRGLKGIYADPALGRALFLLVVGEEELAAGELGRVIGQPMAEGVLRELGEVFAFFDRYRLQFRLTANYYYNALKRQPVADTALWRYAFPRAFWEVVAEQTRAHRISPFFVLAIMREESHYDAKAGSSAGARGLMQLMPGTARMVARRNRLPYEDHGLVEPEVNITLGTLYLKRVLERFDWNPVHAAAAYNAGPGAVRRWTKELGHLPPDEFVESIPYDETRAYVKRVIASYLIYRELY